MRGGLSSRADNLAPLVDALDRDAQVLRKLLAAWSEDVGVDIVGQAREYAKLVGTWKP